MKLLLFSILACLSAFGEDASRAAAKSPERLPGGAPKPPFVRPTNLKPSNLDTALVVLCLVPPEDTANVKTFCDYNDLKQIFATVVYSGFESPESFTAKAARGKLAAQVKKLKAGDSPITRVLPLVAGHGMTHDGKYYAVRVGTYAIPDEATKHGFSGPEWTLINLPTISGAELQEAISSVFSAERLEGSVLFDSCYSGECAEIFARSCDGVTSCLTAAGTDGPASQDGLVNSLLEVYRDCKQYDANKNNVISLSEFRAALPKLSSYEGFPKRGRKESCDDYQIGGDVDGAFFKCPR